MTLESPPNNIIYFNSTVQISPSPSGECIIDVRQCRGGTLDELYRLLCELLPRDTPLFTIQGKLYRSAGRGMPRCGHLRVITCADTHPLAHLFVAAVFPAATVYGPSIHKYVQLYAVYAGDDEPVARPFELVRVDIEPHFLPQSAGYIEMIREKMKNTIIK